MNMNIKIFKTLKETLGTKETYQLIGDICSAYEFLRYSGTKKHSETKAKMSAKRAVDCFITTNANLGEVLINEIESGELISIS